jgi:hypothetical protein
MKTDTKGRQKKIAGIGDLRYKVHSREREGNKRVKRRKERERRRRDKERE